MPTQGTNYTRSLTILTALFFMWGLITSLNDILVPHLKALFELSYFQASLVQFCFFFAYFVMSYPAGKIVAKLGYKVGIILGLLIAAIGCILFYPSAAMRSYPLFLLSLFILASGLTLLQVAANPYVNSLGSPETAASRLNLTQAFNSLGTTIGPVIGSLFILSATILSASEQSALSPEQLHSYHATEAASVQSPYLVLTLALVVIAVIIFFSKLPKVESEVETASTVKQSLFVHRHLILGVVGIFAYVGAEVSIGSYLISFMQSPDVAGLTAASASKHLALYWGGAMIGRFAGSFIMRKIKPNKLLTFNAIIIALLLISAIVFAGSWGMWAVLAIGLFNSIMFPTIFSLALEKMGNLSGQASGLLCMGIVGGAIIPVIQAFFADHFALLISFLVPVVCYLYIAWYGFKGYKPENS
ncbi:L-fucose:H+ symporter permease [Rosenbergiella australiborealis]|uniref:L-fucose:H+ symporter permease n=1 Tax=Rosenbergiella australiborealis TaxID=1544696 RepID=A0ABS5T6P2_9GAMM|nr:L-fucose:H+ symporter permease [Rosenbergiella australiborealis]MBT0728033.1 L-fucose:H+ symporter permease [Rosenbergiella australiborealis]